MNIAVVTNFNGIGLQRDFELLSDLLIEWGHQVIGIQWDAPVEDPAYIELTKQEFDLAIYLEVVPRDKLELASRRWLFANPEWVKPEMIPIVEKFVERVFAKTQIGKEILTKLFGERVVYTGFLARDQYIPEIVRHPHFLHIGGNSSIRGTQAVIDAWRWQYEGEPIDALLHVVSRAIKEDPKVPNVIWSSEISEEVLKIKQNACQYHIYPSGTEGWGHAIHEAMSVNATLIVTARPPMDEIDQAFQVEPFAESVYNQAKVYEVSAIEIHRVVRDLLALNQWRPRYYPRAEFLAGNENFRALFKRELESVALKPTPFKKKGGLSKDIVFLGNFRNEESTENMVKWALEENGHCVWPFQEDTLSSIRLLREICLQTDAFLWIHTRGWLKISDPEMTDFLVHLNVRDIPTIGMHLDKFWGITDREPLIGKHPFWKCASVWTADGGKANEFVRRGVNHVWLKPAFSEVFAHPGRRQDRFACDVAFVGAKDYHAEYPFRRELVEFLEKTYGTAFKHITGIRGHELNDFYASAKIVVGDCIFAGTPAYWSDRVPETVGRGGFLLHPDIHGLDVPVATYKPQDLDDLRVEIDHYLNISDGSRNELRDRCTHYVRRYHTWTVRMREIIGWVFQ